MGLFDALDVSASRPHGRAPADGHDREQPREREHHAHARRPARRAPGRRARRARRDRRRTRRRELRRRSAGSRLRPAAAACRPSASWTTRRRARRSTTRAIRMPIGRATCTMPNVNPVNEMVDLITATRAYEADTTGGQGGRGHGAARAGCDPLMTPAQRRSRASPASARPSSSAPAGPAAGGTAAGGRRDAASHSSCRRSSAESWICRTRPTPPSQAVATGQSSDSPVRRSPSRRRRSRSTSCPRSATRPLTHIRTSCGCRSSARR